MEENEFRAGCAPDADPWGVILRARRIREEENTIED